MLIRSVDHTTGLTRIVGPETGIRRRAPIVDDELFRTPATIEDPTVLDALAEALRGRARALHEAR
jgi:hypothetical protein